MKEDARPERDSSLSAEALGYFVDAFYRMFKIGIYYPVGHVILDQSAGKCLQQLREISPYLVSVHIEVSPNRVSVQGQDITEKVVSAKELGKLLYGIGVHSVEIFRNVTHNELLNFAKSLLSWRSQLGAARELVDFDIGTLPSSIKLVQQEYVVDAAAAVAGGPDQVLFDTLDQVADALLKQGLNKTQVEQSRRLLKKISLESAGKQIDIAGFPNATWTDIQDLLYKIVTQSYQPDQHKFSPLVQNEINVIAAIFQSLERGLPDKKSKEALQFLVTHLTSRKSDDDSDQSLGLKHPKLKHRKLRKRKPALHSKVSTRDLEAFIYKNAISPEVLKRVSSGDNSEWLSILLQLLIDEPEGAIQENIVTKLVVMLSRRLTKREIGVVIGGVKSFLESADSNALARFLNVVLGTLRGAEEYDSLKFIVELWGRVPRSLHLSLWPFVVNELLLVGTSGGKQNFYEAIEIASQIHTSGMYDRKSRLEEMEAFVQKKTAPVIFRPAFIYSYRFYAFLLQTSLRDVLVPKILENLQEEPQDEFIEAIIPLLDTTVPSHFFIFRTYLEQAHLQVQPLAQRFAAGEIILEYLQNITENQKKLPWLAKTIEATANLGAKGMKEILLQITKEKKMGVLYAWPKVCRIAAAKSLKESKKHMVWEKL